MSRGKPDWDDRGKPYSESALEMTPIPEVLIFGCIRLEGGAASTGPYRPLTAHPNRIPAPSGGR
jgi:hypothetical protein